MAYNNYKRYCYRQVAGFYRLSCNLFRQMLFACLILPLACGMTQAASKIYIANETGVTLYVNSVTVSGAALSKKVWKALVDVIPPGERLAILSINRTGKFNWMDPVPRFIEPGKTSFFTSAISFEKQPGAMPLIVTQKLPGTGSGSKMWHRAEGTVETFDWTLDTGEVAGTWSPAGDRVLTVRYHTFKEDKDTNIEYRVSK